MDKKITLVLVDDHTLVREGVKTLLHFFGPFEVIGEAGTAEEGFSIISEHAPDIALIDISLPDASGLKLLRDVRAAAPGTKTVILSMHTDSEHVNEALSSGANGYLVKDSNPEMLVACLQTVIKGDMYLDSTISKNLSRQEAHRISSVSDEGKAYSSLTLREREILTLLAEGRTAKEIAGMLFLSRKTVENYRTSIMNKLSLGTVIDLVKFAVRNRIIDPENWKEG